MISGNEIRRSFLDYFASKGHQVVKSSSLVPHDDPTLLFTNAGMVQFKRVFMGQEKRPYRRATSVQKCLRAGGKHNDLENVGYTARHHTFFEMLGNFSFGDYFKREAIEMAWEYLTEVLRLPTERLWVSVHREDDEASRLWEELAGLPPSRIVRLGDEDNFWAMGDTGPCGPCSEIIIDQGEEVGCGRPTCGVGCDCDRFLELWNLVFMQYNREADGSMTPLPSPSIDTGMGLERIAAVLQGVKSNYDTDLFRGIISRIEEISGVRYGEDPKADISIRVIADHSRAVAFLVADGVLPSNEGRGYVLRRIIRRAARHSRTLGVEGGVLVPVISKVIEGMGEVYPELLEARKVIEEVSRREEERFASTLDYGLRLLTEEMEELRERGERVISGEVIFRLYDTYGFPVDLTEEVAREEGFSLDMEGFHREMEEQRRRGKESWRGGEVTPHYQRMAEEGITTTFVGYEKLQEKGKVLALIRDGERVKEAGEGEEVELITEITPFYAEAGGQVADRGVIRTPGGELEVTDVRRPLPSLIVHRGKVLKGEIREGEEALLAVDEPRRMATARNHTATHILHAVLREVLGEHVRQAGSLVAPSRLRFDFTHFSPIPKEVLQEIEEEVNRRIWRDDEVRTEVTALEEALKRGAIALFGEKYGEEVRVVSVGSYSMELCGGTHVRRTGEIGLFKIVTEGGVAAGVRRIEALTAEEALRYLRGEEELIEELGSLLRSTPQELLRKASRVLEERRQLEKELEGLRRKLLGAPSGLTPTEREIGGVKVATLRAEEMDVKALRELGDGIKSRMGSGIVFLGSKSGEKATCILTVTKDLSERYPAHQLLRDLISVTGGKGGGQPTMAQAGMKASELQKAFDAIFDVVRRWQDR